MRQAPQPPHGGRPGGARPARLPPAPRAGPQPPRSCRRRRRARPPAAFTQGALLRGDRGAALGCGGEGGREGGRRDAGGEGGGGRGGRGRRGGRAGEGMLRGAGEGVGTGEEGRAPGWRGGAHAPPRRPPSPGEEEGAQAQPPASRLPQGAELRCAGRSPRRRRGRDEPASFQGPRGGVRRGRKPRAGICRERPRVGSGISAYPRVEGRFLPGLKGNTPCAPVPGTAQPWALPAPLPRPRLREGLGGGARGPWRPARSRTASPLPCPAASDGRWAPSAPHPGGGSTGFQMRSSRALWQWRLRRAARLSVLGAHGAEFSAPHPPPGLLWAPVLGWWSRAQRRPRDLPGQVPAPGSFPRRSSVLRPGY